MLIKTAAKVPISDKMTTIRIRQNNQIGILQKYDDERSLNGSDMTSYLIVTKILLIDIRANENRFYLT